MMNLENISKKFILPDYLSDKQKEDITLAMKEGTPIIISGKQGPTGKTTLANILKQNGITAYEKWECLEIELNDRLDTDKNKCPKCKEYFITIMDGSIIKKCRCNNSKVYDGIKKAFECE